MYSTKAHSQTHLGIHPYIHALRAIQGILARELQRYLQQKTRLLAALVRPLLWLMVFGTGFRHALDLSILEPYGTQIPYNQYLIPGLIGMILLFNGMQSSLSIVYDREMGVMRLLFTAPLPSGYLLFGKLLASTGVSVIQAYIFLGLCQFLGFSMPLLGFLVVLPMMLLCGLLLAAIGLVLSIYIRQIENFAGAMNFVIFPMFFLSSALYPFSMIMENSDIMYWLAIANPFSHAVELLRFAMYGQIKLLALAVVTGYCSIFTYFGIHGYAPHAKRNNHL